MTDQEALDRAVQLMLDDRVPADAARHLRHLADLCDKQGVLAKYLSVRDLLIASARLCEREQATRVLRQMDSIHGPRKANR
jgi:hypothetical protein